MHGYLHDEASLAIMDKIVALAIKSCMRQDYELVALRSGGEAKWWVFTALSRTSRPANIISKNYRNRPSVDLAGGGFRATCGRRTDGCHFAKVLRINRGPAGGSVCSGVDLGEHR